MTVLLNTLYVTTPKAYLRLEGETVCVMVEQEKRLQIPLHHLGAIVCFGSVMLSPALLGRCMGEGRGVIWLERGGRFQARVEGPVSGNILLRQAQYRAADNLAKTIELARAFLATQAVQIRGMGQFAQMSRQKPRVLHEHRAFDIVLTISRTAQQHIAAIAQLASEEGAR